MTKISAEFNCKKKIRDPLEIQKVIKRANDPNRLHWKDAVYALFHIMGVDITYDEIPLE
ncbi:hypothetical protein [Methanobrevibacter sp.]|uniref:hypothetical protein n=1 Tax=Methanobrevibacter sp. TaxID=66852 RepID=UPI00388FC923